ncbi:Hypothetical protein ZAZAV_281 [Cedratvirus Zaza IHUMI]|uniref:Uncharacterized protein n=1 Tax=Cedratvirus Zaza IHUMI TaxID=2126979 RepID=A0A2R8FEC1_9VIRU|nr:hypothetical protein Cbor_275 [Cedratvirus borely]SPN79349.1 Hypothetical protein ZAZAV_281 [Cedratvirus Zaza IHUMI]
MDYLSFWSQKMYEHMLFINFLTLDDFIKQESKRLMDAWLEVVYEVDASPDLKETDDIERLLQETRQFKLALLQDPTKSNRILPPSKVADLLDHMLLELDYFLGLLNGTLTPQEELKILAFENADHDNFLLHSFKNPDPEVTETLQGVIDQLMKEAKSEYGPDGELKYWLKTSNKTTKEVDDLIKNGYLESIIPDALREHELSEGKWEVERYNYLISEKF